MPYLTAEGKKLIDPKIDALMDYALGSDPTQAIVTRGNGVFFWYFFLTMLYEKLRASVVEADPANGMRYRHYNALHGAYACAIQELFLRWEEGYESNGFIPLAIHTPNKTTTIAYEVGIVVHLAPAVRRAIEAHAMNLVKSFSADFLNSTVGDINYTISEVANALGNMGIVSHQELLDAFATANQVLYESNAFPYEKTAVAKNGDTRGFIAFWNKIQGK